MVGLRGCGKVCWCVSLLVLGMCDDQSVACVMIL
jgi:hypothetical protein